MFEIVALGYAVADLDDVLSHAFIVSRGDGGEDGVDVGEGVDGESDAVVLYEACQSCCLGENDGGVAAQVERHLVGVVV